ncbi:ATPase, T2SS/T4P/T4SS family [Thauera sp. 2A1]|uniref:ATPase, T2SS/T4P/T4SS family n=1 Tax=Thauera sp. 2A1 TaxID=2570191 RepID=UPI0012927B5C|nr:ATPase, T2SS/T4P/T4SS family [Thauera sp. 2A1]KAI5913978.1 ATPase, T2SS/T4P/T4SS family [Thauera sp. 2A1]
MFSVTISDGNGESREVLIDAGHAVIGKAATSAVRLGGWRLGREHARIRRGDRGLILEDLGHFSGTWVNGTRIVRHGPLEFADEIVVGAYRLRVRDLAGAAQVEPVLPHSAAERDAAPTEGHGATASPPMMAQACCASRFEWRKRIHERLLETIDLRRRDLTHMSDAELRDETSHLITDIIESEPALPPGLDRAALQQEVLDEAIGLGPLEALLADDRITEIMVNRHDEIFVERAGRIEPHPVGFTSERAVLGVIERIVAPLGRRIDDSSPMVDARLKDGSRVNAVIAPLALKGPTLTIRKFSRRHLDVSDMVGFGTLSSGMAEFLRICVEQRRNIVVAGGTGSGKTTCLNVLSNFIPAGERIITIEDAAELKLNHGHLVALESRPANLEGRGAVSIRDLVRNALRMRPDRIIVGECRGGEALDMLQAMNTGHEGSLTTLHANSPRDALARLETLVLMAGMELPLAAIREQIASAIDIVVQQTRFPCGTRRITSISEVTGMEAGRIQLQELFRFERGGFASEGATGQFVACDAIPGFYDELRRSGVVVDLGLFARAAT